MLAQLPPALLRGGPVLPVMRRGAPASCSATNAVADRARADRRRGRRPRSLARRRCSACRCSAIQLGSREALLNEARGARRRADRGVLPRRSSSASLERRLADPADAPAIVVMRPRRVRRRQRRARPPRGRRRPARGRASGSTPPPATASCVARTGGDAFAIAVRRRPRRGASSARSSAALERPVAVSGLEIDVRAVAGIACAPAPTARARCCAQADVALRAGEGPARAAGSGSSRR